MESTLIFNTTPITNVIQNETAKVYTKPFNEAAVIVSASILLPLMVIGVIGNLLTIIVISTSRCLSSVFNQFILSLCVSDLLSALISPLFLYRRTWGYDDWQIPSFFCKLYWATDMWTSYVTALHILLFAIIRLISIRWPHIYTKIKIRHARMLIPCLWLLAFLTGFIPFAWWYDSGKRRRNTDDMDARWPACTLEPEWAEQYSSYQSVAFPLFFYVPTVSIISLTIAIGIMLTRRRNERNEKLQKQIPAGAESKIKKSGRKERQAIIQLSMIAGSFMLGYIPFTAYEISGMHISSKTAADERFWWKFGMSVYICLRFSETLNPVFYNLATPKIRNETCRVVRSALNVLCKCCRKINVRKPSIGSTSSSGNDALPPLRELVYTNASHTNHGMIINDES
uniref:growth hormone secretagogue receptor type 1-like isoform X1 n=2 Tax=Styela clava TaxID=7725 RepID=UPI00193AA4BD|nr:growth hormone secretagogue receptor type 1-like isoform X1 [Styela clava]